MPLNRIDKWLWHARVTKSRSAAARLVEEGHVRRAGATVEKPATEVHPGEVLTIALEQSVRVLRVLAIGARRGPASEARLLYEEIKVG